MNKNIIKILIVGAGNIGSRHLEGAVKNKNQLSLVIFDKSEKALDLSKKKISKKNYGNKLTDLIFIKKLRATISNNLFKLDLNFKGYYKKIFYRF